MNLMAIFAGDIISKATESVMNTITNHKNTNFEITPKNIKSPPTQIRLGLQDLDINKQEELQLLDIRHYALNKGMKDIDVIIHGQTYNFDVARTQFTPKI